MTPTDHAQPAGTDPRIEAARAEAMRRWPGQGDAGWVRHGYVLGFIDAIAALDDETARLRAALDQTIAKRQAAKSQRDAARAALDRVRMAIPSRGAWLISADDLRAALDPEEPR